MKKIRDFFSPFSDGTPSSHPRRSKSVGSPNSHRHRGPPLRPPRTFDKSYYVNDRGHPPSYYPSAENQNDNEKERGRSGSTSSEEEDRNPGILFKLGRIAILSPNRSSDKNEGKGSGSGSGSGRSGESSRKNDSNLHVESHSLERTKSSKLRKRQPGSHRMDSIKRRISGSGSGSSKSVPRANPHSPRSSALRNPATGARGNEAPPVPSMPPKWTQKARMAEGEARMLPEMENEVKMVEEGGRKRMPFITVAAESERKPFVTVGAGVNEFLQGPGENSKMQGGASNRREEAKQMVSRKQTEQQVRNPSPWWRGTANVMRKTLMKAQAKGKEEVQKENKKGVSTAQTKEKQSEVKGETAGTESKEKRRARLKREEDQQQEEFNQAQERRKQEEFELRQVAEKAQRKIDRAKANEVAKQKDGKIVAREKSQKGTTERERQEALEKQERSQARLEQAERERQEAGKLQKQQEEEAAELARKEAKRQAIRQQNENRRLQALARSTSKAPAVMVTPATLPEASAARPSAQVPKTANTKNLQAPGPAPLTEPNLQALLTKFGDPEDGDIGDMARTYVQGMIGKTVIEANTQTGQKALNLKRTVIATLAPGNLSANIGDMQRSYVQGMVDVKDANERARRAVGEKN